jgi:hypothetical protein
MIIDVHGGALDKIVEVSRWWKFQDAVRRPQCSSDGKKQKHNNGCALRLVLCNNDKACKTLKMWLGMVGTTHPSSF